MTAKTVIILSDQSLFAEGVAKRLQQFPEKIVVWVVDPREAGAMERIQGLAASAVILDAHDPEALRLCSLSKLMFSNPEIKILRLDSQQDTIQVVSSEKYQVENIQGLVDIIQQGLFENSAQDEKE